MEAVNEVSPTMDVRAVGARSRYYRVDKSTEIPIIDEYMDFVEIEATPGTIETYLITLREFLLFVGGCYTRDTINRVTQDDVERYLRWLNRERQVRKQTQHNKYLYLHAFFNWCIGRKFISTNPVNEAKDYKPSKRAIEKEQPRRPFFSESEVKQILRSIKGRDIISVRDRAMLRMGFYCATRVGEIRALRVGCTFKNPTSQKWWINFRGKGGHQRDHPLPSQVLEYLEPYLEKRGLKLTPDQCMMNCVSCAKNEESPHLFVTRTEKPFTTNQDVTRRLKKYVEAVDLDPAHYASHSMRRSAITLMLKKGMPLNIIQKYSGHKNINILQRYLRDMPSTVEEELHRINW